MIGNIAVFLMVIVGILLFVEIINFTLKCKRMKEKKDTVSLVIMLLSFILYSGQYLWF